MQMITLMFRRGCKRSDKKRDAGLTTPEDVKRYDDIFYGPDRNHHVLDIYRPKDLTEKIPVIVSVHGGGWVYGDKELYQWYCMSLAQRGFAVVNFTYRLAPRFKYPAGIEDTNTVFEWLINNASEYGLDTDNIFAVGDSAGAHMLSVYCDILSNPEYAETYHLRIPENLHINAVALNCGCYDAVLKAMDTTQNTAALMKDVLPHKGTKEELEWISPINHVTKDFPPAYIMTSNEDFLKDQAPVMLEKLHAEGVTCESAFYGTEQEPLGHVFHLDMRSEVAHKCNDAECAFFRKYIK